MQGAGSSFSRSTYCKEYASLLRASARPFRNATARFRHELPWILRVPESGENGDPKLVYLVYLVYVVCEVEGETSGRGGTGETEEVVLSFEL